QQQGQGRERGNSPAPLCHDAADEGRSCPAQHAELRQEDAGQPRWVLPEHFRHAASGILMAVTRDDVPLIFALAALARTSPGPWSEFLKEWKAFTDRGKDQLLVTPPSDLLRAQGRILERDATFKMLDTCKVEAEKLARK